MGWDDPNIYYNPEKFGLTPVAEIDYSSGSYEFDTRVVWKHKDGALYTARDSGCSCPTPFEDYSSLASLEKVNIKALEDETKYELKEPQDSWGDPNVTQSQVNEFIKAVKVAAK